MHTSHQVYQHTTTQSCHAHLPSHIMSCHGISGDGNCAVLADLLEECSMIECEGDQNS